MHLPPLGCPSRYRKVNLATHERGTVRPGDALPVLGIAGGPREVRVGLQLCRELRYPEQWQWLCRAGAEVLMHLNNAVGEPAEDRVWRSHLVSRAAENQRFVLSANAASEA